MMNASIINNYSKLKSSVFLLPIFLLLIIVFFLFSQNALSPEKYVNVQKDWFYYINYHLGQHDVIIINLTQIGDASIFLSLLTIFIIYAPKIWEALLSASLVSIVFSTVLKNLFLVPRPPVMFDNNSFIIIGKTAIGFASLPSGHSITVFTTLTILLFAFMPINFKNKFLWVFSLLFFGLAVVFTRVGVGAHYPLDVIIGSIIGYISGLIGIFFSRKFRLWAWLNNKKYYPIFILLMIICGVSIITKIINENLVIFYLTLITLLVSFYKITYVYFKK